MDIDSDLGGEKVAVETVRDEPVRDLVGYGRSAPSFTWPTGARLAVNVVINYEEGSERNPLEGDVDREPLVESPYQLPPGERELNMESAYEFGSRVGVWRTLDVLDRFGIRPTIFACGMAMERNPAVVSAFVGRGCDMVGHGYRWRPHTGLTREEQADDIRRCVDVVEELTGRQVLGWFTRPPNTVHTRELLAENGLLYDSGAINDDIPYFVSVGNRPLLIVPYSLDINDIRFVRGQFFTARDFAEYVCDSFDVLYKEGGRTPRMMSIGLHPRVIGRPGRLAGLERALEHIARHSGVWFAGRDEIARFWADEFAPSDTWNLDSSR